MKLTSRLLFVLGFLIIYIIIIDARSVLQNSDDLLVSSSLQDDESSSISSSYRHRLEHSPHFQALRWSPRKLEKSDLCEFCDLIVPVVG
jgi:hypothetical protein